MYNETTRLVKVVMPDYGQDEPPVNGGGNHPILNSANPTRALEPSNDDTDDTAEGGAPIMLSDTAENLYIAYEVVAMVKDESTGKTHFSQLKWKRLGTVEEEDGGEAKSVADPSGDGEPIVVKGAMRDGSDTSDDDTSDDEPQLVYQFMFESGDLFVAAAADEYPALDGDELQMLNDDSSSGGGSTGGGVLVVHIDENGILDKTWQEIYDADFAVVRDDSQDELTSYSNVSSTGVSEGTYFVNFTYVDSNATTELSFGTDKPSGYPRIFVPGGGHHS